MAHRCQRCSVQRRVQKLRNIDWSVGDVNLNLAELLIPQRLGFGHDVLERGISNFFLSVLAGLFSRDKRDADADVDLSGIAAERKECTRLILVSDEAAGKVDVCRS